MSEKTIRLADPALGDDELVLLREVIESGMLVQGAMVARFEAMVAERCARKHAIAVTNGTTALELALRTLGVGPGDDVLVPALTWPSPAHAVRVLGANVVLVDVDAREWNARAEAFAKARTANTTAAIVIDQFGAPARLDEIAAVLDGVAIVEDAACAIGSHRGSGPCGSAAAFSTLSFHPRKVVATGEGGMVLTDDDAHAATLRTLRNHGQRAPGVFEVAAGNDRMSELAAALGVAQMRKLDAMIARRSSLAAQYREGLKDLVFQAIPEGTRTNHQTLGALLPATFTAAMREAFLAKVRSEHVEVGALSYALHRLESLREAASFAAEAGRSFPHVEAIVDRGFSLPLHVRMEAADVARVIDVVTRSLVSFDSR